jgi:alkanesulfonate monooxygenase SsuD/methylene tetrahydromethanopterin reductase-like flavin-dependent oxidoreductase (luciferase family)
VVEFGLFYEICIPRPWDVGREALVLREVIEQVRYAEEMGFTYVWLTEHHFLEEFSHCSAPEVMLAAMSQVTTTMRLGHGVVLTPPAFNHPARVAERIATLDCISNGRVEFGTGRSSTPTELEGFAIDAAQSREMWREGLELIVRLLTEEKVSHSGKYVTMPERTVVPRCVQQPHPPLWMAGTSPSTCERAAANGLGVLFFAHGIQPESLRESVETYRNGHGAAKPIGKFANNRLAGFVNGLCGENDADTQRFGGEMSYEYIMKALSLARWPRGEAPAGYEYTEQTAWLGEEYLRSIGPEGMITQNMIMAGNPDTCARTVREFEKVGVDQLIIHMQTWNMPHEKVMESIRMFGTHVIPEFRRETRGES